jgi:ribosomal protein S27E
MYDDLYDDDYVESRVDDDYVESRGGIDQVQCYKCGRNITIYCDDPRTASEIICSRCKQGLAPEWEY